jgi:hypothetical protein
MQAIRNTGFDGFVAQEFLPTWKNQQEALFDAIKRCSSE